MNCQEFRQRISDALAAEMPAAGHVLAHQESCANCRDFHAGHQKLFSSLDAGLVSIANRAVPPSLFPKVREQMESAKPRRVRTLTWVPVGVALVLVCAVALPMIRRSDRKTVPPVLRSADQKPNVRARVAETEAAVGAVPSIASHVAGNARAGRAARRTKSTGVQMEVMFDKEEARGLSRFVRSIDQKPALAQGFLNAAPLPPDETKPAAPIEIAELNVAPLADESR